jgi:hypothetical protein
MSCVSALAGKRGTQFTQEYQEWVACDLDRDVVTMAGASSIYGSASRRCDASGTRIPAISFDFAFCSAAGDCDIA